MRTTSAQIAKSRAAMLAFDEFVKEVTADPQSAGLSDRQQLEKAYKLFLDDIGGGGLSIPARAPDGRSDDFEALDRLAETEAYEEPCAKGFARAERPGFAQAAAGQACCMQGGDVRRDFADVRPFVSGDQKVRRCGAKDFTKGAVRPLTVVFPYG